jgi:hypothetical protein
MEYVMAVRNLKNKTMYSACILIKTGTAKLYTTRDSA